MDIVADAPLQPYRLSVDAYHAMIEAQILTKDDAVELIDGMLVAMTPEGEHHLFVVTALNEFLVKSKDDSLWVQVGGPLTVRPNSEPEPDLALVDRRALGDGTPTFAHLVVEVAYSSRAKDRGRKAALYARVGIPEYWLFDLVTGCVEVRREPSGGIYTRAEIVRPPGPLHCASVALPPLDLAPFFPR